jgi:hypothetical protein
MGGQDRRYRQDAGQGVDRLLCRLAQGFHLRAALGIDLDREADMPVLDHQTRNHPKGNDIYAAVGIVNGLQRLQNLVLAGRGHA